MVVSAGAIGAIDTDRIPGTAVIALALVGDAAAALVFLSRRGMAPMPLAGIGAATLIALAVGGRFVQDHYLDERYSSTAPDYPKTEQPAVELGQGLGAAYDWARGTHDVEDRPLRNDGSALPVRALGLGLEQRRHATSASTGPRGSFNEIPGCPEWIAALNDGNYDYVDHHADLSPGRSGGGHRARPARLDLARRATSSGWRARTWSTSGR